MTPERSKSILTLAREFVDYSGWTCFQKWTDDELAEDMITEWEMPILDITELSIAFSVLREVYCGEIDSSK